MAAKKDPKPTTTEDPAKGEGPKAKVALPVDLPTGTRRHLPPS